MARVIYRHGLGSSIVSGAGCSCINDGNGVQVSSHEVFVAVQDKREVPSSVVEETLDDIEDSESD